MSEAGMMVLSLRELNLISLILRLFLAVLCGGLIGYERGKHQEAAGLRTHILVCVGSCCVMVVGQYMYTVLGENTDPARIGAQVVSGIGFIGAGTIVLNSHHQVRGVTTAAGLWASAAMGLAIGVGYYECALLMCLILHVTLKLLNRMDDHYIKRAEDVRVYMEYERDFHFSRVIQTLRECGWKIVSLETVSKDSKDGYSVQFVMRIQDEHMERREKSGQNAHAGQEEVLERIRVMEGVWYVEEF